MGQSALDRYAASISKGTDNMIVERKLQFLDEFAQREGLLASRGLSLPGNEDFILGLFEGERLIATGSLVGDVIQGVAVAAELIGQGLSAQIVSSLIKYAAEKGRWHVFLFTKPQEANLFLGLGFVKVAKTSDAALLEWGKPDIENYKTSLRSVAGALPETPIKKTSCVVVNCNPFTRGHRHLIEIASARSDRLFVIAVEEELSVFPFGVRFRLIGEGVADLANVTVLKGGRYIVSSATFPSYFTHQERLSAVHAGLDVEIFARHIVPSLGIGSRFVGEEPYSPVTAAYNSAMKSLLPNYNVEVIEIPRLACAGDPISASRVRDLIGENRLADVEPLVPSSTWRYLSSGEAAPIIAKIKSSRGGRSA